MGNYFLGIQKSENMTLHLSFSTIVPPLHKRINIKLPAHKIITR